MNRNLSFIKGLELNNGYFTDTVKPLIDKNFPNLQYSASLLGYGSDVLGYDNETSMDHNWGPRLQIFIENKALIPELDNLFKMELPFRYKGFPTNFSDPAYDGVQRMEFKENRPINHLIQIETPEGYFKSRYSISYLGNFSYNDWLTFTDQNLLEITSGKIFLDGLNINKLRNELGFYPLDICKLRMAVLWDYVWNKEAFIGRAIEINDFIGLKINASRIINYLIKILFYLENKYIPYSKWFGYAFKELEIFDSINGIIVEALRENDPIKIENYLCEIYEMVIEEHNKHPKLPHIKNKTRNYFNRPYKVIFAENIVQELIESIQDNEVRNVNLEQYAHDIILDR